MNRDTHLARRTSARLAIPFGTGRRLESRVLTRASVTRERRSCTADESIRVRQILYVDLRIDISRHIAHYSTQVPPPP